MAIYHLEGKIISRSQGRSSVAAAAYRSASRLADQRTGLSHDFTKKGHDLLHQEVLLPEGAPEWMQDRETLWNHVESIERRKDAQLAREFNIALPKELTPEQNLALAKEFVQHEFVALGMVADLCLHRGHGGGEGQPHMHVMLSLRETTPNGLGQKVRAWNDKALMLHWRQAWAEHCNRHLALNGHDVQIDHRTLEAQGIDLEAQSKIGPKEAAPQMARFERHQRLARRNGERILKDPSIAFTALSRQQSTFTHQDIARFAGRHTATPEQFTEVYETLKASDKLVHLGHDAQGRERFTTQEMLALEQGLVDSAGTHAECLNHPVPKACQKKALAARPLSAEQKEAFSHVLNPGGVACVVGFAGTGKSYMLGAAKEAWEQAGYKVQGMALSGIAAENLEGGSGIKSHTIANRLINWENGRERLTKNHVVVVDEAGMVGSRQMAAIMEEATRAGAKVVLVGDPEQLQAIEAGAAFRAITERTGHVEMAEVRRQKEAWQQSATKQLALQQTSGALLAYQAHDSVHGFDTKGLAINAIIETWQETRSNQPQKSQIILAYTREDVKLLNEKARQARLDNGELGKGHAFETARGERTFADGDRLYFLRNEKSLGVKNGTLGTIEKIEGKVLTVKLDTEAGQETKRAQFHLSDYNDIDHGYAATVHKSQGVTVDRSYVLASKHFDRHTTYVALSRHREGTGLYYARDEFPTSKSLEKALGRERTKDLTLDYAEQRGLSALLKETSNKERGFILDAADVRINFEKPSAEQLATLRPELRELIMKEAEYKAAGGSPADAINKGDMGRFVHEYKLMLIRRYRTTDPALAEGHDKKLDQLAAYAHKRPGRMDKVNELDPKIGKLIQTRIEKIKAKEKGQGIER